MCDFNNDFKLCTCSGEKLKEDEIGWYLQRKNKKLPIQYRRGRVAIPRFSNEEQSIKETILKQLQAGNCFDFDYQAQEDDFLKIKLDADNFLWGAFRFVDGCWTDDNSTSLDGWRSQLVDYDKGKIKE